MARPQPVLNAASAAAGLTAAVGLVLTVLVVTHVLTPDDSAILGPAIAAAAPATVGALSTVLAALRARRAVTPLSSPQTASGLALVPASPETPPGRPGGAQRPGEADHAAPE